MGRGWIALGLVALLLIWGPGGCTHPSFVDKTDYQACVHSLPGHLSPPVEHTKPVVSGVGGVSTVLHPEGEQHYISLAECVALALEKGRVGTTSIRVLAYNPAVAQTEIERNLSRFDTRWRTNMVWNKIDEPVGTAQQRVLTNDNVIQVEEALFNTRLSKPLPTGGAASIGFDTLYQLSNLNQAVNPLYQPRLTFGFEQPLLQGAGVEINQIRAAHPGGVLVDAGGGGGGDGILIARLNFDQSRTAFAGDINELLFAVEQAYWRLYFSYWNLYTQDIALRQSHAAWQIGKALFDKKEFTIQDLALLEQQYQGFRLARLDALGAPGLSVLEAERALRFVIGLPPEDGRRLIPSDQPTTTPVQPDWDLALAQALENRPELIQARQDLTRLQLRIAQAKDLNLPDLRFFSTYDLNGLGNTLDGAGGTGFNAFRSLASNNFNNWTLGLRLDMPLGFREARASLRQAELLYESRMIELRDQEAQATFALQASYRQLIQAYERVRILAALRKAAETQYKARYSEFRSGEGTINFLLDAQTNWIQALRDERQAIFDYNISLADFERQKGNLLAYNHVSIAEGPLPSCVQERASEHLHERNKARILRERPAPEGSPGCPEACQPEEIDPALVATPPTIPTLMEKVSRMPEVPEHSGSVQLLSPAPRSDYSSSRGPVSLPTVSTTKGKESDYSTSRVPAPLPAPPAMTGKE